MIDDDEHAFVSHSVMVGLMKETDLPSGHFGVVWYSIASGSWAFLSGVCSVQFSLDYLRYFWRQSFSHCVFSIERLGVLHCIAWGSEQRKRSTKSMGNTKLSSDNDGNSI